MTQSHADLSRAASPRKENWCCEGPAMCQLPGCCFPTIKQELCHTSHLITGFFTGPAWTGEPVWWLTVRGPFDRLHLQSHLKVAEKSITIPLNVLNWPSQKMNSQVQRSQPGVWCGLEVFNVRCWCFEPVNHYFCRRGDMSILALIDVRFYTAKLLRPSVFSRVSRQLWGQTWQFHGPAVCRATATATEERFQTAEWESVLQRPV